MYIFIYFTHLEIFFSCSIDNKFRSKLKDKFNTTLHNKVHLSCHTPLTFINNSYIYYTRIANKSLVLLKKLSHRNSIRQFIKYISVFLYP